jgi:hypothetical protein
MVGRALVESSPLADAEGVVARLVREDTEGLEDEDRAPLRDLATVEEPVGLGDVLFNALVLLSGEKVTTLVSVPMGDSDMRALAELLGEAVVDTLTRNEADRALEEDGH